MLPRQTPAPNSLQTVNTPDKQQKKKKRCRQKMTPDIGLGKGATLVPGTVELLNHKEEYQ